MKKLYFLIVMMLLSMHLVVAQNFYLPVSSTSADAKNSYYKALDALQHANLEQYNVYMNQAIQEDPDFLMAYAHLALNRTSFKQYDEASDVIARGLQVPAANLNSAEQIMRKVLVLLDKSAKANPIAHFDDLVSTYPRTPQAYELRAVAAYWIMEDKNLAMRDIKKLIKLRPDYAGGYNMLGYTYMDTEKMRQAKKAFDTYMRLASDQANPYDSMGDYYMKLKDYEKSVSYYEKAASLGMTSSKERAEKARSMIGKKE